MQLTKVKCPDYQIGTKCPYAMTPTRIVVHNTENDASAMAEISYMLGNSNEVSFHYAVDDYRVVQGIEENRNAWHAGDGGNGKGNREGIAIEICYSKSGGDRFIKAEQNAVELIVDILKRYGWGIDKVTKHQDYSGKYCPRRTLNMGWDRFIKMVQNRLDGNPQPVNDNYTGTITYQAYTNEWLPQVNKCDSTINGYAGIYGKTITGIKAKCQFGEILIQSHLLGQPKDKWLEQVNSKDYDKNNSNSYSGIYGKPIDCVKISSTKGWVKYRVHIKNGNWLDWVDSRTQSGTESYAGLYGKEIDAIQMY